MKKFVIFILILFSIQANAKDYAKMRERMVKFQIEARGVTNKSVLSAMRKVERHLFVPQEVRDLSYEDYPLPIGENQTISQPYIVGLMTELLDPKPSDKVLEIGTGSGYQAAVLAEIVSKVYTIEIIPSLAKRAEKILKELGYTNVYVKTKDGFAGLPEEAPFDSIIVTCAPPEIPQPLLDQLKENGRLVIPVGVEDQDLLLVVKKDGKSFIKNIIPVRFVPMTGEIQKKVKERKK